jgi:hypothetical protein
MRLLLAERMTLRIERPSGSRQMLALDDGRAAKRSIGGYKFHRITGGS